MMRLYLFIALIIGFNPAVGMASDFQTSEITRIVILGAGTPNPDPYNSGPALAIVVHDTPYLFDFGTGIVRQAEKARAEKGIEALRATNLQYAFLTHLHSDHTLGYADLIFTPWAVDRETSLKSFGPPGLTAMSENITKAYEVDIAIRKEGLQPVTEKGGSVEPTEFSEDGIIYKDENVTIKAFRVCHGDIFNAFGFRVTTPDRVIVISGDTTDCPALLENARGADILISEVYNADWLRDEKPAEWQAYHQAFHLSSYDLGKLAQEVKPKLLVLYHQLNWGAEEQELLDQIRKYYSGPIVYGHDLDVF